MIVTEIKKIPRIPGHGQDILRIFLKTFQHPSGLSKPLLKYQDQRAPHLEGHYYVYLVRYYQTNNVMDRSYRCMTSEGRKITVLPTPEGLHVMDCSEYFGEGKDGYVFGTKITDNNTNFGENMGIPIPLQNLQQLFPIDSIVSLPQVKKYEMQCLLNHL